MLFSFGRWDRQRNCGNGGDWSTKARWMGVMSAYTPTRGMRGQWRPLSRWERSPLASLKIPLRGERYYQSSLRGCYWGEQESPAKRQSWMNVRAWRDSATILRNRRITQSSAPVSVWGCGSSSLCRFLSRWNNGALSWPLLRQFQSPYNNPKLPPPISVCTYQITYEINRFLCRMEGIRLVFLRNFYNRYRIFLVRDCRKDFAPLSVTLVLVDMITGTTAMVACMRCCFGHLRVIYRHIAIEYTYILMYAHRHTVSVQETRRTVFIPYQVIAPNLRLRQYQLRRKYTLCE